MKLIHTINKYSIIKALFAAALSLAVAMPVAAQQQKVVLTGRDMSVKEIFAGIGDQAGYMFIIRNSGVDMSRTVSVPAGGTTVAELLELVLEGTGKTWLVDGKYIIVPVDKPSTEEKRNGSVSGVVYGGSGSVPAADTRVELLGTSFSAKSDSNGRFTLTNVPTGTYVAMFTAPDGAVRYRELTVGAGQRTTVEVTIAQRERTEEEPRMIFLEANPVKAPGSYEEPEEVMIMPAAGTYTLMPVERSARDYQPKMAIKTNLLYWGTTTPNVGLEFYLAKHWSFNAHFGYNAWKFSGQRGFLHWVVQPEARYWFCNVFERGFLGVHGIYGRFNIKDMELPFTDVFVDHHYKGYGYGAGIAWGYHMPLGKRWGMEFSVGAGYVYLEYDKFRCGSCDEFEGRHYKHYFGPTKASVSMVFMIN